jgi:hypothetical protein
MFGSNPEAIGPRVALVRGRIGVECCRQRGVGWTDSGVHAVWDRKRVRTRVAEESPTRRQAAALPMADARAHAVAPPRPTPPQNVVYALSHLRSKRVAAKLAPRDALASASTSRESEVAARLRVSVATLRRLRQRGPGPEWVRIGKQIRYPVSGCEKWLAANLGRVLPKHWRAVGGG